MILRKLIFILILILVSQPCFCDVQPKENATLNYTTIYFEENLVSTASVYELCVYTDSLLTQILVKKSGTLPAFWLPDLGWATTYYWKISAQGPDKKQLSVGKAHTFRIMKVVYQSYSDIKVDVKTNIESENAGGLISIDYTKSIINRKGEQVWAIPQIDSVPIGKMYIRDLRITKDNTITFLTFHVPYEIDFNGKVLWQAPYPFVMGNDTIVYHHDFKKTERGTYMVLGDKIVYRKLKGHYTEQELKVSVDVSTINGMLYKKTIMTVLLEFNKEGKLIWFWDASNYIDDVDLNSKKVEGCTPNFATHSNAFSENKEGTKVYVGFRDLSRIVKLDKKSKQVELSYGEKFPSGEAMIAVDMLNQHDANVSDHNSIYVFNNNGFRNQHGISSFLELKDNIKPGEEPVIWKFDLNFDSLTRGKSVNGGNIVELPNKNLLLCAGALHRIFEISKDKKIVWDALIYAKSPSDSLWQPFVQYRANWINQLNWYHFIAELGTVSLSKEKQYAIPITLYNTGNAEDAYEIEVWSKKNQLLYKTSTVKITANGSLKENLNFRSTGSARQMRVLVKSTHSEERKVLTN